MDSWGWYWFGMVYFLVAVGAYVLGSFPTGVVLTRRKYGIDVREMGSGNIGATNVTRVFGWYAGVLTLIVDFLKGYVPAFYLRMIYPHDPWIEVIAGIGLVVGHCYSCFLRFRGGKGVATSLGVLAALNPWSGLAAGIAYVGLLIVTRISAVGSLGGLAVILIYALAGDLALSMRLLLLVICAIVLLRHKDNIARLYRELRK